MFAIVRWVTVAQLGREFSVDPESVMVRVLFGLDIKLDMMLTNLFFSLLVLLSNNVSPMGYFQFSLTDFRLVCLSA